MDSPNRLGLDFDSNRGVGLGEEEDYKRGSRQQNNTGDSMLKILVPTSVAGQLIGKKGSTINALQEHSGARIKLSQSNEFFPGTGDRVASVCGEIDPLILGCCLVLEKITEDHNVDQNASFGEGEGAEGGHPVHVRVTIASSWAGRLIGKGGETISAIMQDSGARIHISSAHEMPRGVNERICSIRGSLEECKAAVACIIRKMCEYPSMCTYVNSSTSYSHTRQGHEASSQMRRPFEQFGYAEPPIMGPMGNLMGPDTTITMQVADHLVGSILGKGGSTISELQQTSGAKIKVSQKGDYVRGTHNRTVTIQGPSTATQMAQYLINQKLMMAMQSEQNSGRGAGGGGGYQGSNRY